MQAKQMMRRDIAAQRGSAALQTPRRRTDAF
jgi:hypothetical protein